MIVRVFPRRTKATPDDSIAFIGEPLCFIEEADEVHVSCTFTWDKPRAEYLAEQWAAYYPNVKLGGPAYDDPGGEFVPGRYLLNGYVITSRGCNNCCWFCHVPRREGKLRELKITNGHNVLDNNLLQCSEGHIRAVFAMLKQHKYKAEFTGGLEAKLLRGWHVDLLLDLKPRQIFFAYDTPDDLEPLQVAGKMLLEAGIIRTTSHVARCYVLVGYPCDTIEAAEKRLRETMRLGFTPMAMLWKGEGVGDWHIDWKRFQRRWARPLIIYSKRA